MNRPFLFIIFISLVFSCTSKRDLIYFQNADITQNISNPPLYKSKIGDILKITILNEELNQQNLIQQNYQIGTSQSRESLFWEGYQIDNNGNITYPRLGRFNVVNLSITDIENLISDKLTSKGIIIDSEVKVKVINWDFTVLGEVNNPGRFFYDKPNLSIIQAIGMAGDLSIDGDRNKIRLIRKYNDKLKISDIDLTKTDIFNPELFYIYPGDIIVVDPNQSKIKSAGLISNPSSFVGILSFIISTVLLINNIN